MKIVKDVKLDLGEAPKNIDPEMIATYTRVYLSNQRQGTSKVKDRSEVSGGGKKPWRQKGTGRARAGSIRSPLWKGGGVIHGPTPKSWNLALNRKFVRKLFQNLISFKLAGGDLAVFSNSEKKPSTKKAQSILDDNLKILVIHNDDNVVYKSFRNIPNVQVEEVNSVCAYDLLANDKVLVEEKSIKALEERVKK